VRHLRKREDGVFSCDRVISLGGYSESKSERLALDRHDYGHVERIEGAVDLQDGVQVLGDVGGARQAFGADAAAAKRIAAASDDQCPQILVRGASGQDRRQIEQILRIDEIARIMTRQGDDRNACAPGIDLDCHSASSV